MPKPIKPNGKEKKTEKSEKNCYFEKLELYLYSIENFEQSRGEH